MRSLHFDIKEKVVGWLEWDQPDSSVNLMSFSFIEELERVLNEIDKKEIKALVLVSKKPHSFCTGADIKEFQKIQTYEELSAILDKVHDLFSRFEKLNLLKIVAINGSCLGGGLEWALCFDRRLLARSSSLQIGLPEVRLGLIPGFGGCLRLPRLVGLRNSLNMIISGKSLNSKPAYKIGLVDYVMDPLILEKKALEIALNTLKDEESSVQRNYRRVKPYLFFLERTFKPLICFLAKKQILKRTKGFYPAPLKALKVIQKTYGSLLKQKQFLLEREAFCELFQDTSTKNLIRVWNLMDQAKKPSAFKKLVANEKQKKIERVGILGAGVMGRSIAYLFADKGFKVRLIDNHEDTLFKSSVWIKALFKKQKISSYDLKQKNNNISFGLNQWGLSSLDLLIEALPENKELKHRVISEISKKLNSSCLFASNTSSLSLSDMSKCSLYPENFFGLHFFNPAHKMPLIELSLTDLQINKHISPIFQMIKKINKTPLLVKDSPGFVVNRLLVHYLIEALLIYGEGYEIERIDRCYRSFGMPLGPFELMDKIGIDTCVQVIEQFRFSGIELDAPQWTKTLPEVLGKGEKDKKGFYIYKNQKQSLNEKLGDLNIPLSGVSISDREIIERGLYRMINEGKSLVQNQGVRSESDIDLALILGMGFPPFLGGPMFYAREKGYSDIKKQLKEFEKKYGKRFQPCF